MKKLFLALPFLLAGCQAERVAFQFQPVAPASGPTRASSAGRGPASVADDSLLSNKPVAYAKTSATLRPAFRAQQLLPAPRPTSRRPLAATGPALAAEATATLATPAPATTELLASKQLRMIKRLVRQRATAGPAHTAENGLGGIALFFIGVFLAVLAGLGALVSLLPGISFLGGVGLAAAGLVVLFLLYKLFSGGGKQKPAK